MTREMMRMRSWLVMLGLAVSCAVSVGCQSAGIAGKVVTGRVSTAVLANPDDPRLENEGVAGAQVRMLSERGGVLDTAVTNRAGEFAMTYPLEHTDRVLIIAGKEGYLECRARLFAPRSQSQPLLVLLEPLNQTPAE